jgi:hypothetical protein
MNATKCILIAALFPVAIAACGEASAPGTGRTQSSLPAATRPATTDVTPTSVPSADQAVGGTPTPAAKAPASTADMAKEMTKQDESSRMPLAGQGANHSPPNSTPAGKPPGN